MPFVEYEELYMALIAVFAALAVFVGGWDIPAIGERQARIRSVTL